MLVDWEKKFHFWNKRIVNDWDGKLSIMVKNMAKSQHI
jgi:hypothetical protein